MKLKVLKLGEKSFEEKKAKMFEVPTSDMQLAKKGLTKEEQLRLVFKKTLEDWGLCGSNIDNVAYLLLKEVKIRVKL